MKRTDPAPAPGSPPAARPPRTTDRVIPVRTAVVITVVIAVVLAGLVGVLGRQWRAAATASATEQSRTELRHEAGGIVAQVFSVDAGSWKSDRARARGLVGGEFAARYATELTRPPAAGARSITWTPDVVGVIDAAPDRGDTLIRATVVTTPAAADSAPITEKRTVAARFTRDGDKWLVTRVEVMS